MRRPANPSKSGFTFEGWYRDNETFLEAWDFAAIPTKDITLYAKWIDDGEPSDEPPEIQIITDAAITIAHPVTGAAPSSAASGSGNFAIGAVSWSPGDNPFIGGVEYTATVTLTAHQYFVFAPELNSMTVNGNGAVVIDNTENTLTLSYQFPPTKTVTDIAITAQPKLSYTHGETLDLSSLVVTFTYNDSGTENVPFSAFALYGITASLAHGTELSRSAHNGSLVTITYGSFTRTITLTVSAKATTLTVDSIPAQPYTGSAVTPTVTVKDGATTLTLTDDYTVSYNNNTNAGTATVDVTGAGNYAGSSGSRTFVISPNIITFTIDTIPAQTYNGSAHTPMVTVKAGAVTLTLTTDYTVSYTNNTNAGTATVTIAGAGNYAGSSGSATFTINPRAITFAVDAITAQTYTGSAIRPEVTVRDGTTILTLTDDYTVGYSSNINAGTASVTITGAGNYADSAGSASFTINPRAVPLTVGAITARTYTGSEITPGVTVSDGSTSLALNSNYTVTYGNNINAGTATVTITGVDNYAGSTGSATFTINKADPTVTWPAGLTATYGQTLANITLPGNTGGTAGSFSWTAAGTTSVGNAGTRTHNMTFTPTNTNYNTLTQDVNITVNKANGAAVSAPSAATTGVTSVTLNAATAPATGQTVEYAHSTTNTAPTSGWQTGVTFSGLTGGTVYYFFARSAANDNFNAGAASAGTPITTMQNIGITVTLDVSELTEKAPNFDSNITLSRTGAGGSSKTASVAITGAYQSINWEIPGVGANASTTGTTSPITLDAENVKYNSLGWHAVTVTVTVSGMQYQTSFRFRIVE